MLCDFGMTRDLESSVTGLMLSQASAKTGVEKYVENALEALCNDFLSSCDAETFDPADPKVITNQQKRKSPKAMSVLKEKRCRKLKGRTCADGRK